MFHYFVLSTITFLLLESITATLALEALSIPNGFICALPDGGPRRIASLSKTSSGMDSTRRINRIASSRSVLSSKNDKWVSNSYKKLDHTHPGKARIDDQLSMLKPDNIHVTKFGGTSVGDAAKMIHVSLIIKDLIRNESSPIVVLSAMSSSDKSRGTTSRLLYAVDLIKLDIQKALAIIDDIKNIHVDESSKAIRSQRILKDVISDITMSCRNTQLIMQNHHSSHGSLKDDVMSLGEELSAKLFTHVLRDQGISSCHVDLSDIIDHDFDSISPDFYVYFVKKLKSRFAQIYRQDKNIIPVVGGYFGKVPGSMTSTIGRGYTDLTASLIAVAIQAKELQIYKEVDGVFTTDPNKVSSARILPTLNPEVAAELTFFGSEVIHQFTMSQVMNHLIPIRILNTFNANADGTIISPVDTIEESVETCATAVALKNNASILNIRASALHSFPACFSRMRLYLLKRNIGLNFCSIAQSGIPSNTNTLQESNHRSCLVNHGQDELSLIIYNSINTQEIVTDLQQFCSFTVQENVSIITMVGRDINDIVGIKERMISALIADGIEILMTSQGNRRNSVSCIVKNEDGLRGLRIVHDSCVVGGQVRSDCITELAIA